MADRDVVEIATLIGNRLEYLEIDGAAVGNTGLSAIAAHCPQLRHLSVANAKGISDGGLAEVVKHCPQLQFLDVSKSPDLTTEGLVEVLSRCGNLTYVDVSGIPGLNGADLAAAAAASCEIQNEAVCTIM